jgi:hypothetical protein
VGISADRVRVGSDVDGVSARSGERVGSGSVAVGDGIERVDVGDGRSTESVPPQELSSTTATARPTARIIDGTETTLPDPAPLVTRTPIASAFR